jgi:putative FmdB family regulatory protein
VPTPDEPGRQRVRTVVPDWGRAMATYAFVCTKCKTSFEVTCHMDEREAQAVCPKCGSHKVGQVYTAAFSSPRPDKY